MQMSEMEYRQSAPAALLQGIEEFNRTEYYECHETLEALWMAEAGPVRDLYKGILQIGVALYHLQAGRYRPVITLLIRGTGYLRSFAPDHMGVNIDQLLVDAARCLAVVENLGPGRLNEFNWSLVPKIETK